MKSYIRGGISDPELLSVFDKSQESDAYGNNSSAAIFEALCLDKNSLVVCFDNYPKVFCFCGGEASWLMEEK